MNLGKAHDFRAAHVKFGQGCGKGYGFGQAMFGQAAGRAGFQRGMDDKGARRLCSRVAQPLSCPVGQKIVIILRILTDQSSPS